MSRDLTPMYARRVFAIAIATFCIHGIVFAQNGGVTTLHDFDGMGDVSSLRTDRARFELVDGGRADRGQALRVSFDAVPDSQAASPALVFDQNSLPNGDFSQISALGFWVKNEGDSGAYLLISVQDRDGRQSSTSPDRFYVSPGAWRQVVYRLELQGLDRKRIGALHLFRKSNGPALPVLFDDFELLSPLAARLASLENAIRNNLQHVQTSAKEIGLEAFIEDDADRLAQRLRDASSLAASERVLVLSALAREASDLAATINYRRKNLTLRGRQVTDAWLAACAPKIADAERVHLYETSITDAGLAHLRSLEHLDALAFSSPGITGSGLKGFASAKLRNLYFFEGSGVNDVGLKSVANFPQLERLELNNTGVTNAGLRHIAGITTLKGLSLRGKAFTDEGLSHLGALSALEYLNLRSTDVHDLAELGELKKLQNFDLRETRVDDAGLAGLGPLPALQILYLSNTDLRGPGLAGLKDSKQLWYLDLKGTRVNDAALAALVELPKLTRLEVSSTRITDATLARVARAGRLTYLDIYGTNVTADGIRRLGSLKNLTELYAGGTGADDTSIAALGGLGKLFHLDLQGTRVTDASLETIGTFKNLNSLNLSGTGVTGANIAKLSGIEELRTLNLAGTGTSNEALDTIAKVLVRAKDPNNGSGGGFAWLNRLFLADTAVSDAGLENISRLKHLFVLDLDGTQVSDKGLERIALLPTLESLRLDGTTVSDDGLAALSNLHQFHTLSLKGTRITDEALSRIGDPIVRLSLSHTSVSDAGVRTLAGKERLQVLELAGTAVTDDTLETISRLPNLRLIDLAATPISDRGVATLKTLPALDELRLDRTAITDQAAESLARFTSLGKVSLEGTRVTADGKALLARRHPELAIKLDFPRIDAAWTDGESFSEMPWSSSTLPEDATVADLARLTAVRSLNLQHRTVDEETLVALRNLTNLESLDLADTSVDDVLLANLIGLPRLRVLRLSRTAISDEGLQHCTEIVRECCERFRSEGIDIVCHHRDAREGFKSGALAAGLETATGELVAIFDADFVPAPDFLQRTVHHFTDEKVGVVQAEWRHLNRDESTLTQCQAMFLDGHFVVEQAIRARTGRWFIFNGTAGLWRRACIDKSGGWRHDTLTEDTDLSYRAQLDGWRFVYLPDVHADAELPSTMGAFLSQQHRWTRGLLQCAVKLLPRILFSKAPLRVKAEAWFHLTAPILYVVMFVLTALAVPATFVTMPLSQLRGASAWALGTAVFFGGTLAAAVFYLIAQRAAGRSMWWTLVRLPVLMALGVGMSAVNTRAAVGALLGSRSPFVRTPKFGGRSDSEADPDARRAWRSPPAGAVELLISGVLLACLFLSVSNDFALIGAPFLVLFAAGFLWVGGARFVESGRRVTVSTAVPFRALRWSAAAVVVSVAVVIVLGADSIWRPPPMTAVASRVAGVDLTRAEWKVRGSSVARTEARLDGLTLDVDLDPELGGREEGEIFIELTGLLAPLGASLSDSQELVFDIAYPHRT